MTRGGVLFVLALLLTGAGAFLSANNLLFLVFSAMLALLLVSGFLSRLVLAGLELELLLPEHVVARAPVPAVVRIRNLKRLTPSFSIELAGRFDPVLQAPPIMTGPVYFPLIPGRSFVTKAAGLEAQVEVTFPQRGMHHNKLFVLSTKFPFGFLRKTARVTLHKQTLVYPCLEPGEGMEALLEQLAGDTAVPRRGASQEFYGVRRYEATDSAHLVDWKSTAHTGELQVREFSREEEGLVEIYLDRRTGAAGPEDWFERAVEGCAFLAWHLEHRATRVILRSQGEAGVSGVYGILSYLALVRPLEARGSMDPVDAPFGFDGVQVAFTQAPEAFRQAGWRCAEVRVCGA